MAPKINGKSALQFRGRYIANTAPTAGYVFIYNNGTGIYDLRAIAESDVTNLTSDLALKAPLASPAFTGTPSLPTGTTGITQSANDNSTKLATTAFVVGQVATVTPLMDSTGAVGTSLLYARQDHVHPSDTTKANLASPTFTGTPVAPTASVATNTTQLATCAYVLANANDIRTPVADVAYTIPDALNRLVVYTSLSAARVITLPTAAGRGGQRITVVDESGSCSPTKTLSITRAGSDTVDGGTGSVVITGAYSAITLESDGTSKWVTVNYEEMTYTVADSAYVIATVRDIIINYTSITVSRVLTLPAATTTGQRITVIDTSGSVSGTNTIVCTRAGSDTINGGTTYTMVIPYGYIELVCDGNGHWNASMGSPVFGTSTTTFLRNDGTWQTTSGSGVDEPTVMLHSMMFGGWS